MLEKLFERGIAHPDAVVYVENDHRLRMAGKKELKVQVLRKGIGTRHGHAARGLLGLCWPLARVGTRRTISIVGQSGGLVWHVRWRGTGTRSGEFPPHLV